jgi:hypothetical protein
LEFDAFSMKLYCPNFEINADSGDKRGRPSIVTEAKQEAGFTHT